MCFSEKISWLTLIIGTIVNFVSILILLRIKNPKKIIPIIIILLWQFALLMQIADALAWRDPSKTYPGKLAFILNTMQPLILILGVSIMLFKLNISLIRLIPVLLLSIVYICYVIRGWFNTDFDIYPKNSCKNLQYIWWNKIPFILYILLLIIGLLTIPSIPYSILTIILFLVSLLITNLLVNKNCISGSLWCWSVASCGLITFLFTIIMYKYFDLKKKNEKM